MLSASARKSFTDLSRRRARSVFTVATLAIAVASVSFLAIPTLIDRAMQQEVRDGRLADVTMSMRPTELTDRQLAALAAIPDVAAVEARSGVDVRVLVGTRRAPARVIGVRDFAGQNVDVVRVESGAFPDAGQLLADVQDANVGVYDGSAGATLRVIGGTGGSEDFVISGRGRTLPGGELVQDEKVVVLYAPVATVARLSGHAGYDQLAVRLDDASPASAAAAVEAVRRNLSAVPGFAGFSDLPQIRAPGDWPGKADTENFAKLLSVITVLAMLSALVLVSSTMSTLVSEQTREIGIMRALGARRRQVAALYLRATVALGALGALLGTGLGIALSSGLAHYFGTQFWAVDVGAGVDPGVALAGVCIGLLAPPLAALPAVRRGLRVDLGEALGATGSALGAQNAVDRALGHAGFLPRSAQIGLRNVGRRKRRSLATVLMVALAVGNLVAVLAMARAATDATRTAWGDHLEDVEVYTGGQAFFDPAAEAAIRSTPGVAEAQPVLKNTVKLGDREAFIWGVQHEPLFRYRLAGGRWFTAAEDQGQDRVAVIERNLAQQAGVKIGDPVTLSTATGEVTLRVVGMAKNQQENGTALYLPLSTARSVLGQPVGARSYWIRTVSHDPASVDRVTGLVEDRLAELGYPVTSEVEYVAERDEVAANRSLTTTIGVLGFVVVAMSMVGLANAITTNVLERTREIGILRCIGARARDIRRIFMTEGTTLALGGWLLGIPLGYLLDRALVRLVWEVVGVRLPVVFPPANLLLALAGTVVLAWAVLALPVRRAVRFRPGDALRYS